MSLWTIPVVVVHEHDILTGSWPIRPRVTGIAIDLSRHVSVQGLNGTLLGVLLIVVLSFLREIQHSSEYFRLRDGAHTVLTGLESFLAPTIFETIFSIR